MSTSKSEQIALGHTKDSPFRMILSIEGTYSGRRLGDYSAFFDEQEVLFDIGDRFRFKQILDNSDFVYLTLYQL